MKTLMKLVVMALLLSLCTFAVHAEDSSYAVPENSPAFDVAFEAPEGATVETDVADDTTILNVVLPDHPDMKYVITVAADDHYAGRNLTDFSEAELKTLFDSLIGECDPAQSAFTVQTLEDGLKVMVLNFKELPEVANVLTILDGYYFQVFGMYNDFTQPVAQADVDTAVSLLDAVHVMPVKAAK